MRFVLCFSKNYLLGKKGHQISLVQIIQSLLTENSTYCIAKSIYLNLDIILQIKMI